jgi:quinol monooxygenase YgiN
LRVLAGSQWRSSARATEAEAIMELMIFARFHVRAGCEEAMLAALADVATPTRAEAGCLFQQGYQSIRDSRLFYVHSRWTSDDAFEIHATLAHTVRFLARVQELADQPPEITRARPIEDR